MVVSLHALAVFALAVFVPGLRPTAAQALSVSLLSPQPVEAAAPVAPKVAPPPLRHVVRRPVATPLPPVTLSESSMDAAATASTPPSVSVPEIPAAPPAAPPAPVLLPVQQPRFDADYLDNPVPVYPALSRRLAEQGRVVLRVHVDVDGRPTGIELASSSGHSRLDEAALAVVERWKFVPARRGTQPVAAWVLVPVAFTLKD